MSSTVSSLVENDDDEENDTDAGDDDSDEDDALVGVGAAETGDDDAAAAAAELTDVTPTELLGNDTSLDVSLLSDDQNMDTTFAITAKTHSGLWRSCLYWDESGNQIHTINMALVFLLSLNLIACSLTLCILHI